MEYQNIKLQLTFSGQFILDAQWTEPVLYTHIFLPFFSFSLLFVLNMQMVKRTIYQDVLAIDIRTTKPFIYLKNENWHKLMSTFRVCGTVTLYTIPTWNVFSVLCTTMLMHLVFGYCGKAAACITVCVYCTIMTYGNVHRKIFQTLKESITEDE